MGDNTAPDSWGAPLSDSDGALPIAESPTVEHGRYGAMLKRALDVAVATVLLILLVPLVAVIAVALLIESPGPLFYRCERVGYGGRRLRMLKLRKMHPDAPAGSGITVEGDPRLTRVGAWLARLKIDEIPQLWHVLRGDMSLVGPRPEDPRFVRRNIGDYSHILQVRPGITGVSQLTFVNEARILDSDSPVEHYIKQVLPNKLELDRFYAARRSFTLDLRVLAWTGLAVILRRPVVVDPRSGAMRPPWRRERPSELASSSEPA